MSCRPSTDPTIPTSRMPSARTAASGSRWSGLGVVYDWDFITANATDTLTFGGPARKRGRRSCGAVGLVAEGLRAPLPEKAGRGAQSALIRPILGVAAKSGPDRPHADRLRKADTRSCRRTGLRTVIGQARSSSRSRRWIGTGVAHEGDFTGEFRDREAASLPSSSICGSSVRPVTTRQPTSGGAARRPGRNAVLRQIDGPAVTAPSRRRRRLCPTGGNRP